MGQQTRGIYPSQNETWYVDKQWRGKRIFQRGFPSFDDAERWLIRQLAERREVEIHGERSRRTFDSAAAHYLTLYQTKTSIVTETYMLQGVMPYIGEMNLATIHDSALAPFVTARLDDGIAHKTINLALGVVRRILNLAATTWRDDSGLTWLSQAPRLTMLPLVGHQREPMPISWEQQKRLLPLLPDHLARMSLFVLNTGVRDKVVCNLQWSWEIPIPELGVSVFDVPRQFVKGRMRNRLVVCNSVAQSIVDTQRGKHPTHVFVWRRERVKNTSLEPAMAYQPIAAMNNNGWQTGRVKAKLGDLHVHDLRHTAAMRLREAGVSESTVADILWHNTRSMTHHYSAAQIVELHGALERIKADNGDWNKSLATLRAEHESRKSHAARKTG